MIKNKVKQFLEDHYKYIIALIKMVVSTGITYGLLYGVLPSTLDPKLLYTLAVWIVLFVNTVHLLGDYLTYYIQGRMIINYERKIVDELERFIKSNERINPND